MGDRIAGVGWMPQATARRRIDASRLVVAPGFIDMMGQSEYSLLVDGRAASKITQGITTEITGEGSSIAPLNARMLEAGRAAYEYYGYTPTFTTLAGYFQELERRGTAVNLGTFVGAGGVRDLVIGQENRAPTAAELEAMKAAVAQAMEEGALGLSSALIYVPGLFASTDELIALARVAARYGGSYITHQRDEGDDGAIGLDASMDEVFRIAREAQIPAEIYHLKASGKRAWGRMPELLRRIERGAGRGPGRERRPVPVGGQLEQPRREPARLGARGRSRAHGGAPHGPRHAGPGARRLPRRCRRTPTGPRAPSASS